MGTGRRLQVVQPSPPRTRGDCVDGERPCPWTSCRFHLAQDRSQQADDGFVPDETCALDVADRGGVTLRKVGRLLGMTREGARIIQEQALTKLRSLGVNLSEFLEHDEEGDAP